MSLRMACRKIMRPMCGIPVCGAYFGFFFLITLLKVLRTGPNLVKSEQVTNVNLKMINSRISTYERQVQPGDSYQDLGGVDRQRGCRGAQGTC